MEDRRLLDDSEDLPETDFERESSMPSWLFVCRCGVKFKVVATGDEESAPVVICPLCGAPVKAGI